MVGIPLIFQTHGGIKTKTLLFSSSGSRVCQASRVDVLITLSKALLLQFQNFVSPVFIFNQSNAFV